MKKFCWAILTFTFLVLSACEKKKATFVKVKAQEKAVTPMVYYDGKNYSVDVEVSGMKGEVYLRENENSIGQGDLHAMTIDVSHLTEKLQHIKDEYSSAKSEFDDGMGYVGCTQTALMAACVLFNVEIPASGLLCKATIRFGPVSLASCAKLIAGKVADQLKVSDEYKTIDIMEHITRNQYKEVIEGCVDRLASIHDVVNANVPIPATIPSHEPSKDFGVAPTSSVPEKPHSTSQPDGAPPHNDHDLSDRKINTPPQQPASNSAPPEEIDAFGANKPVDPSNSGNSKPKDSPPQPAEKPKPEIIQTHPVPFAGGHGNDIHPSGREGTGRGGSGTMAGGQGERGQEGNNRDAYIKNIDPSNGKLYGFVAPPLSRINSLIKLIQSFSNRTNKLSKEKYPLNSYAAIVTKAHLIFTQRFGIQKIQEGWPYQMTKIKDFWIINGSKPKSLLIVINSTDGSIVKLTDKGLN